MSEALLYRRVYLGMRPIMSPDGVRRPMRLYRVTDPSGQSWFAWEHPIHPSL